MLAPTGTAKNQVALLNAEIVKVLKLPDVQQRLANDAAVGVGSTPAELGAHIKSEIAKWGSVIRASKATAD